MDKDLLQDLIDSADQVYPDSPILAQVCVTQAILESGFLQGGSVLADKYNNLFGIKGEGTRGSVYLTTNEYYDGSMHQLTQRFAVNADWADSFAEHKDLLARPRYQLVREAISCPDAFEALQRSGYATDINYAKLLTEVWQEHVKDVYNN